MYTLYQHKNKVNGKIYIGITKQKPIERWGNNGINYKNSTYFYSAIKKYGWENFEHNIVLENLTKEEAMVKEKEYISLYQSNKREYGYNSTSGGDINFEMNEEIRQKKSISMRGNKNGCHPCSEEKKQKIREAEKGRVFTEEHKQNLKIAAKNRKSSPCSEKKKIKLQNNYPYMKKVYCEETKTIYKSIQECARQLGIIPTNICAVCKGKHKTYKGYHFKYVDNI